MYGIYVYYHKMNKFQRWFNKHNNPEKLATRHMKVETLKEAKWQVKDEQSDFRKIWSGTGWKFYYKKLY